jgi:tRNA/rRNA methyltransferase
MELTQQDVRTLWGAVVRLAEGPRLEAKTRKREKPAKRKAKKAAVEETESAGQIDEGMVQPKGEIE